MTLGALLDAGCDIEQLRGGVAWIAGAGWELSAEKVWKTAWPRRMRE